MKFPIAHCLALAMTSLACTAPFIVNPPIQGLGALATPITVDAPTGVDFRISAGDRLLARTTFFEVESLVTEAANSFTISGYNIGVNLDVTVAPTTLPLCFQTEGHLYYVAPFGAISNTGNYSIDELDFVGLRVSKEDGALSWFLDQNSMSRYPNSHNIRYTAKASDVVYNTARSRVTGRDGQTAALYYRGYFDGKVHFELQDSAEYSGGDRELFQFNIDQGGLPELIAIKGLTLEVVAVNATHLECRWIEIQ